MGPAGMHPALPAGSPLVPRWFPAGYPISGVRESSATAQRLDSLSLAAFFEVNCENSGEVLLGRQRPGSETGDYPRFLGR